MILNVTLSTGKEFQINLKENNVDSLKDFGEVLELAPGRMFKTLDNSHVRAGSIEVMKEIQ